MTRRKIQTTNGVARPTGKEVVPHQERTTVPQSHRNVSEGRTIVVNPIVDYDCTQAQFVARINALKPQGYRHLSLSAYGADSDRPRFAAVWDKRIGPSWRLYINCRFDDFQQECIWCRGDGYSPVLITAVGGGVNRTISGVLEQIGPFHITQLTVDQSLAQFSAEVTNRTKQGWVIQSATIYDAWTGSSRVAAVWRMNTENGAWNVFAGLTPAEHQAIFNAQQAGSPRPAFVTGSTNGRLLTVYRDDQIEPMGQECVVRHGLTIEAFLNEKKAWLGKGLYTVCLQGYGFPRQRYAAIFMRLTHRFHAPYERPEDRQSNHR
jgi:Bacterial tandem repeat domain 1